MALAGCGISSAADFSFDPYKAYLVNQVFVNTVAIGDVTGDGRADLVGTTGMAEDSRLFVYVQRADHTLADPLWYAYITSTSACQANSTLGDFNTDGILDIALMSCGKLYFFMANGTGGFIRKTYVPQTYGNVLPLHSLDVDRDGKLDLVGTNGAVPVIFFGSGDGGIAREQSLGSDTGYPEDIAVGDLNGDGFADIAVSTWGDTPTWVPRLTIYYHDNPTGFRAPLNFPIESTSSLAIGDFNRDGRNDLATGDSGISVWLQTTTGQLARSYSVPTYNMAKPFVVADLDGDHDDDLMALHYGWWAYGYYLQRNRKLEGEYGDSIPYGGGPVLADRLAIGDIDGDGCNDAAVANDQNGLLVLHGKDCMPKPLAEKVVLKDLDTDGNGKSDLLFRDVARDRFVIWYMSGNSRIAYNAKSVGAAYRLVGSADFNNDKRTDLLWTSPARDLVVSLSTGSGYINETVPLAYASGWTVVGAADVNGNGAADVLLRNEAEGKLVVWYMQGSRRVAYNTHSISSGYQFVGSGDLNRDGQQDLVWTSSKRDVLLGISNGASFTSAFVGLTYNASYELAGVSDINGDGMGDLLLRSRDLGKLTVWFMNGTSRATYSTKTIGGNYRLVGKGDFNGDHRGDLAWIDGADQVMYSLSTGVGFSNQLSRYPFPKGSLLMDVR